MGKVKFDVVRIKCLKHGIISCHPDYNLIYPSLITAKMVLTFGGPLLFLKSKIHDSLIWEINITSNLYYLGKGSFPFPSFQEVTFHIP